MLEIERKYLVNAEKWKPKDEGVKVIQGYLSTDKNRVVRVRTMGDRGYITIKGKQKGISRTELEYEIPHEDVKTMLELCVDFPIEKTRYYEKVDNVLWEIDVFEGMNKGLLVAEVELENEKQTIMLPDWAGQEVSTDYRYFNAWLSQNPYTTW